MLLRPLPFRHPERLVVVWHSDAVHRDSDAQFDSYREFDAWRQHSLSFEKLSALTWATGPRTLLWQGKPLGLFTIPTSVFGLLKASLPLMFLAICTFAMVFNGCGSSGSGNINPPPSVQKTPAGSYTVNIVATSGVLSHSVNVTLVVQ